MLSLWCAPVSVCGMVELQRHFCSFWQVDGQMSVQVRETPDDSLKKLGDKLGRHDHEFRATRK